MALPDSAYRSPVLRAARMAAREWTPRRRVLIPALLLAAAGVLGLLALGHFRAGAGASWRLWSAGPGCVAFLAGGLVALIERPAGRVGVLMLAVGAAWPLRWLTPAASAWVSTVGVLGTWLWVPLFAQLAFAFPDGRVTSRAARRLLVAIYAVALGLQAGRMLVLTGGGLRAQGCWACEDELTWLDTPRLGDGINLAEELLGCGLAVLACALFLVRWRRSTGAQRRALAPVLQIMAVAGGLNALYLVFQALGVVEVTLALKWLHRAAFALVPLVFTYALVRTRVAHGTALGTLLRRLQDGQDAGTLRVALGHALDDPTIEIVYWVPGRGYCRAETGALVALPDERSDRAFTPVLDAGEPVAALIHDPWLLQHGALVRAAGAAVGMRLRQGQLEAELRRSMLELQTSRARLVGAADAERRRLERDLHDGAQQRLSALLLHARLLRREADGPLDARVEQLLSQVERGLQASLRELRAFASGVLPPVLADFGLAAAIEELAVAFPLPAQLDVIDERLPAPVELTAYFVVAEALANTAKHAEASRAWVAAVRSGATLRVEVGDDGIGGAAADGGSGLHGLQDRVGALGGTLTWSSAPDRGTVICAELPLGTG